MERRFKPTATRLLDQVREVLRFHHYSFSTEKSYVSWILKYIRFNDRRHPKDMGRAEIERFLSHLALNRDVAASTQNQALNAILFLYHQVLGIKIEGRISAKRSQKPKRLPTVLTKNEVKEILGQVHGVPGLLLRLMYGSGLRVTEALKLRVNDIDIDRLQIYVRNSKGDKDRTTLLPRSLVPDIRAHLVQVRKLYEVDVSANKADVYLPPSVANKYRHAGKSWGWQYFFPARQRSLDPRSGRERRHHVHKTTVLKAIRIARNRAGLAKTVTPHVFRHSFATHLLEDGVNIRTVQTLLGHKDVKVTEIYTHVMDKSISGVLSPLETLD